MNTYKAEVTLNEKDSLLDLLNLEKSVVKSYAFAVTEGCSQGFRNVIKKHLLESASTQMDVFLLLTELGYYSVESEDDEKILKLKQKFLDEAKKLH